MSSTKPRKDAMPARRTAECEPLAPGAVILRRFAQAQAAEMVAAVAAVARAAPFRHMITPGGHTMSVAMTNCGAYGWVSDRTGYRYEACDPQSGRAWPAMPALFEELGKRAAIAAGFAGFAPDSCLINRYAHKVGLSLHQDKDEADFAMPIVSVSLGLPAIFLFGGHTRRERPRRATLANGDVVVWGGPARLAYHGVAPLSAGDDPLTGSYRYNLTLRRAH